MAIRRVQTKPTASTNPQDVSQARTQTGDSHRQAQHLQRFRPRLTNADDVDELVRAIITERTAKHLVVFYLDAEHGVISYTIIADGPLKIASMTQRELFKKAFDVDATAIVVAHHHPEGHAEAIPENIEQLRHWREAGRILKIPILDVVIVTEEDFVSLRDHLSRSFTEPQW